jgi:CubicO group peptidase (beta-lactamase class C family)
MNHQGKFAFPPKMGKYIILAVIIICLSCNRSMETTEQVPPPRNFQWEYATPESQGMSSQKLDEMLSVLEEKGTKKLLIIKNDKIVYEWYAEGWEDSVRGHYTASLAKALVGGMSLLAAMDDKYITLDEAACNYIPSWKKHGVKSKITIRQLATHTSGLIDAEGTEEETKIIQEKNLHPHFDLPGWKGQFWRQEPDPFSVSRDSTPVDGVPGESYAYSNPGIGMLTYAVTASLKNSGYDDVRNYLKERIYEPIGIDEKEYSMGYGKTFSIDGLNLVASWGGGGYTARSIARIGLLMLHKGKWMGKSIIDSSNVERVIKYQGTALPKESSLRGGDNYRNEANPIPATTAGWYCNYDGIWGHVPRDAFAAGGAGNQHLFVVSCMNLVVVRMGSNLYDESKGEGFWLGAEKYLFNPVMNAITEAPYPKSNLSVEFAPADSVIRMAEGCDNWPATWADDGNLYTSYGDGWGFSPKIDIKLSLGLCKITGDLPHVEGINIRSNSGERVGQGKYGEKASGMLMVDGMLYMLVRNAQNARLMWSADRGNTWEQADWRFDISFGCPSFLNYGRNYEDAKDDYVYIYSQEESSAYKNADYYVMARINKDHIKDWRKYQFFNGLDERDNPAWTDDIRKRSPVFVNPGKCYRSGITYNKGLEKYIWSQVIQMSPREGHSFTGGSGDIRFRGGLGIFESDNPWGPWKTVFYTREWDMGPGETSSVPAKWMSEDGKTCWLLFSGDDFFSLRMFDFVEN